MRFQYLSKDHAHLPNWAKSTFGDKISKDGSRCRLRWSLLAAYAEINGACGFPHTFLAHMLEEHRQLFGTEGYGTGMIRALVAMAFVFDWPPVRHAPMPHMVREFGVLAGMLLSI